MKYIITENQIKRIIEKNFGLDLTDKIHMVTSKFDLPKEFRNVIPPSNLNFYLNQFGPMYVIDTPKGMFLAQDRGKDNGNWLIANDSDFGLTELDVMGYLGIEYLGLSMGDLINTYITD